jgi:hypothetical protein
MYMKSLSFASLPWTVTILIWALNADRAFAFDEWDLPPPGSGYEDEIPLAPPPQDDLEEENLLPAPGFGDNLPDPALERRRQSGANEVNRMREEDDIFLPTPTTNDHVNYAPLGSPVVNRRAIEADWRSGMMNRPVVSLHGGFGVFNYPTDAVQENRSGPTVGASVRLLNLGQTIFLHAYGSYSWVKLGPVGPFPEVRDAVLHYGGLIELGIGRRLSLFGSLLRRGHTLAADPDSTGQFGSIENYTRSLVNEGWKLGAGIQYDFHVIPHGSLGVRAHVEQDMGLVVLTMALEPVPRKRMNLNFQDVR